MRASYLSPIDHVNGNYMLVKAGAIALKFKHLVEKLPILMWLFYD
jgi:hypothetical protein